MSSRNIVRGPMPLLALILPVLGTMVFLCGGCGACSDKKEGPTLIDAIRSGQETQALQMIREGASTEQKDKEGRNPLMHASRSGMLEVVKALIQIPVNLESRDKSGSTALILAADAGKVEAVKLLLDAGADKAIKDNSGWTARDYAETKAHTQPSEELKRPFKEIVDLLM